DPERRTVVIDGKTLTVASAGRHDVEKIDVSQTQKRIDQYFTHASVDQLRSMFDITATHDASARDIDRVVMQSKRKPIKQGLERLELWIDTARMVLVRMEMTFPSGDTKLIALEDVSMNVPIDDNTFRVAPRPN